MSGLEGPSGEYYPTVVTESEKSSYRTMGWALFSVAAAFFNPVGHIAFLAALSMFFFVLRHRREEKIRTTVFITTTWAALIAHILLSLILFSFGRPL